MYPLHEVQSRFHTSYDRTFGNSEFNNFYGVSMIRNRTELIFFSAFGLGCIKSIWLLAHNRMSRDWHVYVDGVEVSVPMITSLGKEPP